MATSPLPRVASGTRSPSPPFPSLGRQLLHIVTLCRPCCPPFLSFTFGRSPGGRHVMVKGQLSPLPIPDGLFGFFSLAKTSDVRCSCAGKESPICPFLHPIRTPEVLFHHLSPQTTPSHSASHRWLILALCAHRLFLPFFPRFFHLSGTFVERKLWQHRFRPGKSVLSLVPLPFPTPIPIPDLSSRCTLFYPAHPHMSQRRRKISPQSRPKCFLRFTVESFERNLPDPDLPSTTLLFNPPVSCSSPTNTMSDARALPFASSTRFFFRS